VKYLFCRCLGCLVLFLLCDVVCCLDVFEVITAGAEPKMPKATDYYGKIVDRTSKKYQ
jgi:hypothetical protein